MAAAGLTEEVVEIVQAAECWVDSFRVSRVGLKMGEKYGVRAEGVNVVEAMNDAMEGTVSGGAEVDGIDLIDDGALPPDVGGYAGTYPAGAREGLSCGEGSCCRKGRGDAKGEDSAGSSVEVNHALAIEMLREMGTAWVVVCLLN